MLCPRDKGLNSIYDISSPAVSNPAPLDIGWRITPVASPNRVAGEIRCNIKVTSVVLAMAGTIRPPQNITKKNHRAIEDSREVAIFRNKTEKSIAKPIQKAP